MTEKTIIGVSTSFKGTHNWPEASTIAGDKVQFLENKHRHTFYVDVEIQVHHDDRDVEFFVLQSQVNDIIKGLYGEYWDGLVYNLGRVSCETISRSILDQLETKYKYTGIQVQVSEDNEVWARITK